MVWRYIENTEACSEMHRAGRLDEAFHLYVDATGLRACQLNLHSPVGRVVMETARLPLPGLGKACPPAPAMKRPDA